MINNSDIMIGLFIGSFNPPTKAHLDICLKLKDSFKKIVLVPVNNNNKEVIDINKRIDMLNILKNKYSFLEISTIMKEYAYINYRIIDLLKSKYQNINIIMGSDLLEKFIKFDNYEYLLENYYFTIVPRNDIDVNKLINYKFKKYQDKFRILDYHSDISSTLVKKNLKENKDVKSLLDNDILRFIQSNHLY